MRKRNPRVSQRFTIPLCQRKQQEESSIGKSVAGKQSWIHGLPLWIIGNNWDESLPKGGNGLGASRRDREVTGEVWRSPCWNAGKSSSLFSAQGLEKLESGASKSFWVCVVFFFWELCNPRENKQNNNTKAGWILFLFSSCLNNQGLGIPLFPLEG